MKRCAILITNKIAPRERVYPRCVFFMEWRVIDEFKQNTTKGTSFERCAVPGNKTNRRKIVFNPKD
jgi:hypothetical protein